MRTPSRLLLLFLLLPFIGFAQTRLLTVEEATGMNPKLNAASLGQLQWRSAGQYVYVVKNCLVGGTPGKTVRDTLVRLYELNVLMKIDHQDTLKRFPAVTFLNAGQFYFTSANKLFLCDIMKNSVTVENSWPEKTENLDIDKSGKLVAYTLKNNLYISKGGRETAVSDEKNPGIVYGSNRVHRNEFGIDKGTFWSPDGQQLAFYRMDETMVADYPLVDITPRIAAVNPTKYPMAGMTSHKVTVGVYDRSSGKTTYLQTASSPSVDSALRTEYLTNITWSPDGKFIYIATLNRDQNFMQLNRYEAATGKFIRTLFEEQNKTYVEPLQGPKFLAERLIVFHQNGVSMFEGGYQRFLDKNGWEDESPETAQLPVSASVDRLSSKQIRKLRSEIITRRSKSLKPMETRLSAIEKDIEHHEAQIADFSHAMTAATQENDGPRIVKLSQKIHHSQQRIESLFGELEALTASYEAEKKLFDQRLVEIESI